MKLNYVIVGSDLNPLYLDFWPAISKIWRQKFNLIPVLGLICDEDSDFYENEYGIVKKFKKNPKYSEALQSQIVRIFLPSLLNGYCLISDIDMIPLSLEYFTTESNKLNENNIVVYSSDNPECLLENMYPMCYISAHSEIFKNEFVNNDNWDSFCNRINSSNEGWYTDQKFIFRIINEYHKKNKNCIFLNRGWNGPAERRIDRINWKYDSEKVSMGYYIDAHSLRPYQNYKNEINNLINLVLS
jgi:hypothetical protein